MKKILVVRNDKIGDFMLAWPSFAMLKQSLPDVQISALVPSYTAELAKLCPWIDEIILDPGKKASIEQRRALIGQLRSKHFDASINLFSNSYNAQLVWRARIRSRWAPATKLAQIFYNHRVRQRRSQSAKPEYQYNLDLIRAFLAARRCPIVEPEAPFLRFTDEQLQTQRTKLAAQLSLSLKQHWTMLHVGSGGSANNLSIMQYAELIAGLAHPMAVVITAGPGEQAQAEQLQTLLGKANIDARVYSQNDGLRDFACSLACAALFIAGSTGPLHIAAALDVPTIGFFPAKRSATPLRWQPLNSAGRHLGFCPTPASDKAQAEDMSRIDLTAALAAINPWLDQFWS